MSLFCTKKLFKSNQKLKNQLCVLIYKKSLKFNQKNKE